VTGDGGIGNVRQAELAEQAAGLLLGASPRSVKGRNPSRASSSASSRRIRYAAFCRSATSGPEHGDLDRRQIGIVQQLLLAAEHWRPQAAALAMESFAPSLVSTSQAASDPGCRLPGRRCFPTAVRVKLIRSPSAKRESG